MITRTGVVQALDPLPVLALSPVCREGAAFTRKRKQGVVRTRPYLMELAGLEPATPFSARLCVPIQELSAVVLYVFAAVTAGGGRWGRWGGSQRRRKRSSWPGTTRG